MKEDNQQVVKEFLTSILPCIENIDGGCHSCIGDFIIDINEVIEKYDLQLKCTEDYPIKVNIYEKNKHEKI